jgi:hypothetical protein
MDKDFNSISFKTSADLEDAGYKKTHTSLTLGYVTRKGNVEVIERYKGRFGEGYTVKTTNNNSSQYCYITYYVR